MLDNKNIPPLSMKESAKTLATRGFRVIPVHNPLNGGKCSCGNPECRAPGKHPRIGGWADDATSDIATISQWFDVWPHSNVGITFGRKAGIVDIEVDPRNGGKESIKQLQTILGALPPTRQFRSGGGGLHRLYRYPRDRSVRIKKQVHVGRELLGLDNKAPTGVDVLSDGSQAVAPPSRHTSGKRYEWINIDDPIVDLPAKWIDYLKDKTEERQDISVERLLLSGPKVLSDVTIEYAKNVLDHIDPSLGYDQWMRIGQALHLQFGGSEEALDLFDTWSSGSADKYPGRKGVEGQWRSYGKNSDNADPAELATFRGVIALAKEGGWTAPRSTPKAISKPDEQRLRDDDKDLSDGFKRQLREAASEQELQEIAFEIRKVELFDQTREELIEEYRESYARIHDGKKLGKMAAEGLLSDAGEKEERAKAMAEEAGWYADYVYLSDHRMGSFFNKANATIISPKVFDDLFSIHLISPIMRAQGKLTPIFPPSQLVLNCELVERCHSIRYAPGMELMFDDEGVQYINSYREPPEAKDHMLWSSDEEHAILTIDQHLIWLVGKDNAFKLKQFIGYLVQHPRKRVRWCFTIYGPKGIGKSFCGDLAKAALGAPNVKTVGNATLQHTTFNSWAAGSHLNVVEEIRVQGTSKSEIMDSLKAVISNDVIDIHQKGKDPVCIPNVTSYMAFTNYPNALNVDKDDRRYYIVSTRHFNKQSFINSLGGSKAAAAYFVDLFKCLEHTDAIRGWFHSIDLTGFEPNVAEDTHEKADMADAIVSDVEASARKILDNGTDRYNWTVIDLDAFKVAIAMEPEVVGITGQSLSRLLRDLGFRRAADCPLDPLNEGKTGRWYVGPSVDWDGTSPSQTLRGLVLRYREETSLLG